MTTIVLWYTPRRSVLAWICAGYTSFACVFGAAWVAAPRPDPIASSTDRAVFALQLAALPAAVMMTILQGVWRVADTVEAEADLLGGRESPRFKVNQRAFSNRAIRMDWTSSVAMLTAGALLWTVL